MTDGPTRGATGQSQAAPPQPAWRGVAAEDAEEITATLGALLRDRSRRLLASLARPHRRALLLCGGLLLANNLSSMAGPYLVELGIDRGIPPLLKHQGASVLVTVVVVYLVAVAVRVGSFSGFIAVSGRMGQDVLFDLRTRLFDHFQRLSLSFHEHYTSGRVTARLTSDIEAITDLLDTGLQSLITSALSIVTTLVILLVLDVRLGLVTLVVFSGVVALTRWFRSQSAAAYRESRTMVALVIVHFTESLGGIRVVQAFRREARNREIMDDVNGRYCAANAWSMRVAGVYGPGVRLMGHVAMAVVLLYGGSRVIDHQMTLGALAAFTLYLRKVFDPMQELSQFYNTFQAAAAALEKLAGVLEEQPSVPAPDQPRPLVAARGEVRFERVGFGYGRHPVLHDVDLVIPAGQTVALVGATGAGKSTLARLITRFYDPTSGRITLDGVDLRDIGEADMRRAVAMVTQESFLFAGTVSDNIAFGRPGSSPAQIVAAAKAVGAHEFIRALEDGYATDVAKRGGRLSAGQRQLVSFARALLADPRVLILDEATSSLDIPSERLVQRALRTVLADRTAVIIAHRLTTVEIADRVLVVDGGRIVEDGAPHALLARDSRYRALHEAWQESLV